MSKGKEKPRATIRAPRPAEPEPDARAVAHFVAGGEAPANVPERLQTSADVPRPRARRARDPENALVSREDGRTRRRTTVYFDVETAEALTHHCEVEGRELSRVVDGAVRDYLTRKGLW